MKTVHATAVSIGGKGVLLRGPSGSGKSDLALRLIGRGAVLVADDQVVVGDSANGAVLSAPPVLRGLIEARGVGLLRLETADNVPVRLVVDLVPRAAAPRLPEPQTAQIGGIDVPLYRLHAFDASVEVKIEKILSGQTFGG